MILVFLGLKGSGKTTQAARLLKDRRAVIFSPDKLFDSIPYYINDRPDDLSRLPELLEKYRLVRVEVRGYVETPFPYMTELRDCTLLLDDIAVIVERMNERQALSRLVPLWRRANVDVIITGHLSRSDIPNKIRTLADSIYWFGPLNDDSEIELLWRLRKMDYSKDDFHSRLRQNPPFNLIQIR